MNVDYQATRRSCRPLSIIQSISRFGIVMKVFLKIFILVSAFSNIYAQGGLHQVLTILGEKPGDHFGYLQKVGDVNGDGYSDLVISASVNGYSKLYLGSASFDSIADYRFNYNVCSAGDINHDGFDDIALINYVPYHSIVKICLGSAEFDTIPDIYNFNQTFYLSSRLFSVGDVNADGYDDFFISNADWGTTCIGCYYPGSFLYLGGKNISKSPYLTFHGKNPYDGTGYLIFGYDINNDHINDILFPTDYPDENNPIFVYYGGEDIDTEPDTILTSIDNLVVQSMENAGDLENDNIDNLLMTTESAVYIYNGFEYKYKITWGNAYIGTGGDIDNDGYNDFLLSNTNFLNDNAIMVGQVRVYFGNDYTNFPYKYTMEGETKWGEFGRFMTIPGDLNGDGFDEIVISAWKFPDYEHPTGKVYIYSYKNICSVFNPVIEKQIKIIRNYPNPFNSTINIQFQLLINLKINIDIYNSIGQHIVTLLSEYRNSGTHTVSWNGKDKFGKCVNSGIYFYILTCASEKQYEAGKIALIK